MKQILDMTCGSRMFWYQPENENVEFVDRRKGTYDLGTYSTKSGEKQRTITVSPTTQADFRNLPFKDNRFYLVVFDPPHLKHAGKNSRLAKKYGVLSDNWQDDIKQGFNEAMRVLKTNGTLIFKWSEDQIPVKEVLTNLDVKPLFGDKRGKTRWLVFYKFPVKKNQVDELFERFGRE